MLKSISMIAVMGFMVHGVAFAQTAQQTKVVYAPTGKHLKDYISEGYEVKSSALHLVIIQKGKSLVFCSIVAADDSGVWEDGCFEVK